jgi:hypothetical protein
MEHDQTILILFVNAATLLESPSPSEPLDDGKSG